MSNFSNVPQNTKCECYKKLQYLGVTLSESEDDEFGGEYLQDIHYDRIFELPGTFIINSNISEYPIVRHHNLPEVFYQMAQLIPNLSDFEVNMLSFWVMDMFVEGLWTAQRAGMHHEHQRITLLWIAYLFNYVQKHNPSRKELFRHLKKIIFMPDYKMSEYTGEDSHEDFSRDPMSHVKERLEGPKSTKGIWELPAPPGIMVGTIESDSMTTEMFTSSEEDEEVKSTPSVTKTGDDVLTERNTRDMKVILEIIYRIFARLWVYLELQAVLRGMPSAEQVKLPFNFGIPKPALKVDPFVRPTGEDNSKLSNFSVPMSEEIEPERQLFKNDYILPLQASEEAKAYFKQNFSRGMSDPSITSKAKDKKKQG